MKKHNNQIMHGCNGKGDGNDHDEDDDNDTNSNDDNCDGNGGSVDNSDGGATDNNQLKLQKWRRLQLDNGWVTASQRQRQG